MIPVALPPSAANIKFTGFITWREGLAFSISHIARHFGREVVQRRWDVIQSVHIGGMADFFSIYFMLQFPIWWAYAGSFAAALVASVTAIYCAVGRITLAATGRSILPQSGADAS